MQIDLLYVCRFESFNDGSWVWGAEINHKYKQTIAHQNLDDYNRKELGQITCQKSPPTSTSYNGAALQKLFHDQTH